jgi:hypothetical protein
MIIKTKQISPISFMLCALGNRQSAVGIVTVLYTAWSDESLFDSQHSQELYLFSETERPALGHI